jgi:hypothetical protein
MRIVWVSSFKRRRDVMGSSVESTKYSSTYCCRFSSVSRLVEELGDFVVSAVGDAACGEVREKDEDTSSLSGQHVAVTDSAGDNGDDDDGSLGGSDTTATPLAGEDRVTVVVVDVGVARFSDDVYRSCADRTAASRSTSRRPPWWFPLTGSVTQDGVRLGRRTALVAGAGGGKVKRAGRTIDRSCLTATPRC